MGGGGGMCAVAPVAGRVDLRLPHVVEPRQIPGGQQLLHVHLRRLRLGLAQGRGLWGMLRGLGPAGLRPPFSDELRLRHSWASDLWDQRGGLVRHGLSHEVPDHAA